MTILYIALAVVLIVAAVLGIGVIWAVKLGEDDPEQFDHPQEDERHQWRNASVKVPHAGDA